MANDVLAWAESYRAAGLHPVPLAPRTKKPPLGKWKAYQTRAPTQQEVEAWFLRHPDRNVALVLGRGLIALDLDGPGAQEALEAKLGAPLPTDAPRSATSNGCHIFLRAEGPVENRVAMLHSAEKKADGKWVWQVDVRADGGYVVVAPSIHPSGHAYEWERRPGPRVPAAPQNLLELVRGRPEAQEGAKDRAGAPGSPKWVAQALAGVGEGQRDDMCAKLAGYFQGKGVPPDIALPILYGFADRCTPPFPRAEVDKTVKSVSERDAARVQAGADTRPFHVLGYNHGSHYYLPRGSQQVVELRADQHTKLHFLRLAPLQWWEETFQSKSGPDWELAANQLLRLAERAGVYDAERVRGRGAWWENSQAVLHLGDQLVVGNHATPIRDVQPGAFLYEAAPAIPVSMEDPLDAQAAGALADICETVSWERPINAHLLAGWCVVAPICGALAWRPHVWISGSAGTGKTWVVDKIVRPLLGKIGFSVQSETTEAGIRQTLGSDARPITFDEIEGEDERARIRVQNILGLARQASSDTDAAIIKGSPGGDAKRYRIRSSFAFSSIGVGLQHFADNSRVTVLSLDRHSGTPDQRAAHFVKISAMVADTVTEEFAQRFIARSVSLIPVIRENARTFGRAGARTLGSQRFGDQIGTLLAGAHSLYDDGLVTAAEAEKWIESQDWDEQRGVQEESDEERCLRHIMEFLVRVQLKHLVGDRSIGELAVAVSEGKNPEITGAEAYKILGRMGIKVDDLAVTISNTHTGIAHVMRGTRWATNWGRTLKRIEGARTTEVERFGESRGRGIAIPLSVAL